MTELIFCLGAALVYAGAGIIVALGLDMDLNGHIMFGICLVFWPVVLFILLAVWVGVHIIELFRRE